MVDNVRASPYQQPLNATGYLTSNAINNVHRFEPCQNFHNTRTTIYDAKPLPLVIGGQLPRNDNYITTNNLYHKAKYFEDCYVQPEHPKAPGIHHVAFVRPEFNKRVDRAFNLSPIYDCSETRSQFGARGYGFDMFGGPRIYTPTRDLYARAYKDYIYPFDPAENSVLKLTHPYMTTNMIYHREFTPDEMNHYETLTQIDESHKNVPDVAIKYRVRPMHDAFEQKLNKLCIIPSLDEHRQTCDQKNWANRKIAFRRQLYNGTAPRTCPALANLGMVTSYADNFSNPWRQYNKESTTHEFKLCYLQPKGVSFQGAMKIPNMYTTESATYGTGRGVDAFVRTERILPLTQPKHL